MIVASLVEAEGPAARTRRKVARVIYNRLEARRGPTRLLQIDAAVNYGLGPQPGRRR